MATVDIAPFLLIDPPPGAEEQTRAALAACSFPFHEITPMVAPDPQGRVTLSWGDIGEPGVLARYTEYQRAILWQQNQWSAWGDYYQRVLIHEIGHMVDYVYLNQAHRAALIALMVPPDQVHPHNHPWKGTHREAYYDRIHEAWADVFVRTYAPGLYNGGTPYTHTIDSADAVKAILSTRNPMQIDNIGGANRFETGQIASMRRFPYNTPVEVVIAATDTPDAEVAASYVAAAPATFPATLLLVNKGQDAVPSNTLTEIDRLRFGSEVAKITYVGGTAAITQNARNAIESAGRAR